MVYRAWKPQIRHTLVSKILRSTESVILRTVYTVLTRFEVIMDNGWFSLVEVFESVNDLGYDGLCFPLCDGLVLF